MQELSELLQQRLEAFENGKPLEACLDGLTKDEIYLLQLAATLHELHEASKKRKGRRRRNTTFKACLAKNLPKPQVLPIWLKPLIDIDPILREIVLLRFWAGMSLNEVAQSLGSPAEKVVHLQHDGLKALRQALGQV